MMNLFQSAQLIGAQQKAGLRWAEFFRSADLSVGHYLLPAGGRDEQQPHSEDEIYYVLQGSALIHVSGEERAVSTGAIVYVPAGAVHYFHSIQEDLHLLVFFAPPEGSLDQRWQTAIREDFLISTDRRRLDVDLIYRYLSRDSYWARGIERERLIRAIDNSLCFGVYRDDYQVAFGRVVTDLATFAYISDFFVLEPWRGHGVGRFLLRFMLAHPELQGLRKWVLHTRDAHPFYEREGFERFDQVPTYMEYRP